MKIRLVFFLFEWIQIEFAGQLMYIHSLNSMNHHTSCTFKLTYQQFYPAF